MIDRLGSIFGPNGPKSLTLKELQTASATSSSIATTTSLSSSSSSTTAAATTIVPLIPTPTLPSIVSTLTIAPTLTLPINESVTSLKDYFEQQLNTKLPTSTLTRSVDILNAIPIELIPPLRCDQMNLLDDIYVHHWGGRYHCIPEDYVIPTVNCKSLWDLWFWGNKKLQIKALHYIDPKVDFKSRKDRGKFSKAKIVIQKIIEKSGETQSDISLLSMNEADLCFERGFKEAIAYDETSKRRYSELIFTTTYSILMELEKSQAKKSSEIEVVEC